jgi:hypothetical protein
MASPLFIGNGLRLLRKQLVSDIKVCYDHAPTRKPCGAIASNT